MHGSDTQPCALSPPGAHSPVIGTSHTPPRAASPCKKITQWGFQPPARPCHLPLAQGALPPRGGRATLGLEGQGLGWGPRAGGTDTAPEAPEPCRGDSSWWLRVRAGPQPCDSDKSHREQEQLRGWLRALGVTQGGTFPVPAQEPGGASLCGGRRAHGTLTRSLEACRKPPPTEGPFLGFSAPAPCPPRPVHPQPRSEAPPAPPNLRSPLLAQGTGRCPSVEGRRGQVPPSWCHNGREVSPSARPADRALASLGTQVEGDLSLLHPVPSHELGTRLGVPPKPAPLKKPARGPGTDVPRGRSSRVPVPGPLPCHSPSGR